MRDWLISFYGTWKWKLVLTTIALLAMLSYAMMIWAVNKGKPLEEKKRWPVWSIAKDYLKLVKHDENTSGIWFWMYIFFLALLCINLFIGMVFL